jgi:hypothetical protein
LDPIKSDKDHLAVYESSNASAPHIWVNVNDEAIQLNMEQVAQLVENLRYLQDYHYQLENTAPDNCVCLKCGPPFRKSKHDKSWKNSPFGFASWMAVCPQCGNKRCPGALSHNNPCSGSNDPGQKITPDMEGYTSPPWEKADMTEEAYNALPIKEKIALFFKDEEVTFNDPQS